MPFDTQYHVAVEGTTQAVQAFKQACFAYSPTSLREQFSFEKMCPTPELLKQFTRGAQIEALFDFHNNNYWLGHPSIQQTMDYLGCTEVPKTAEDRLALIETKFPDFLSQLAYSSGLQQLYGARSAKSWRRNNWGIPKEPDTYFEFCDLSVADKHTLSFGFSVLNAQSSLTYRALIGSLVRSIQGLSVSFGPVNKTPIPSLAKYFEPQSA